MTTSVCSNHHVQNVLFLLSPFCFLFFSFRFVHGRPEHLIEAAKRGRLDQMLKFGAVWASVAFDRGGQTGPPRSNAKIRRRSAVRLTLKKKKRFLFFRKGLYQKDFLNVVTGSTANRHDRQVPGVRAGCGDSQHVCTQGPKAHH